MSFDYEDSKDAWKQYLRIMEKTHGPMLSMLDRFAEQVYDNAVQDCIEAVEGALIPAEPDGSAWNQPINVALEYLGELRGKP